MNGNPRSRIDEILNAINYGEMTPKEAERRLQQIIKKEESQKERPADAELLYACYSLLFQLNTHGSIVLELDAEKSIGEAQKRYNTWIANAQRKHVAFPAVLAAVLALIICASGLFHFRWFSQTDIENGQLHAVQGHETRIEYIKRAIADRAEELYQVTTTAELKSILGSDFGITEKLGFDWNLDAITVYNGTDQLQIVTHYSSSNGVNFVLTQFCYTSIESAWISFEQDKAGEYTYEAEMSFYISTNHERLTLMWIDTETVYHLSGDITEDEGYNLVKQIRNGGSL